MSASFVSLLMWYAFVMFWNFDYKAHHAERQRQHEADAPDRALRLSSETVRLWTDIVKDAAMRMEPGTRPCDYRPWRTAFSAAGEAHGLVEYPGGSFPPIETSSRFSGFLWDVAMPRWPEPRRDLIEFAIAALDADVKLFRSGYAQKHLIKRLQQTSLKDEDVARVDRLLRRAVTQGSGFEEYRAWCKLAGHLVAKGHLSDLPGWLAERSDGAVITSNMMDGWHWQQIEKLSEEDQKLLLKGGTFRPSNGVLWPNLATVVSAGDHVREPDQRIKRNAWRMLDQILRRCPQVSRYPSSK